MAIEEYVAQEFAQLLIVFLNFSVTTISHTIDDVIRYCPIRNGNFFGKKLRDFNILSVKKLEKNTSIDLSYLDVRNCSSLELSHLISLFFCFVFSNLKKNDKFCALRFTSVLSQRKRELHITGVCLELDENTALISSVRRPLFHLLN